MITGHGITIAGLFIGMGLCIQFMLVFVQKATK
jgi:hypothetical protein